jgi:hypothetical protein
MEQQLEFAKAAGKPFVIQIEIKPDNDDCDCVLCAARREMFDKFMNRKKD